MFDTFQAMRSLKMQPFAFKPSKFDVWESGKIVHSHLTNISIISHLEINEHGSDILKIEFKDEILFRFIKKIIYFDVFFTQSDRLLLASIPKEKASDSIGLNTLRNLIGETNGKKILENNEPYCCALFLKNGVIKRLSFSFNNPVRLLEFETGDEIKNDKHSLLTALKLIEMLIENYDQDDTYASESYLVDNVQDESQFKPTKEHLNEAFATINSIFPTHNDVVRKKQDFFGDVIYISSFDLSSLRLVKNSLTKLLSSSN